MDCQQHDEPLRRSACSAGWLVLTRHGPVQSRRWAAPVLRRRISPRRSRRVYHNRRLRQDCARLSATSRSKGSSTSRGRASTCVACRKLGHCCRRTVADGSAPPKHAIFHDGTPVTAAVIAPMLRESLSKAMGAAFEDVDQIAAGRRLARSASLCVDPPPLLIEALETTIQKPAGNGVGHRRVHPAQALLNLRRTSTTTSDRPTIEQHPGYVVPERTCRMG